VTTVNNPKGLATICQGISPNGGTVVGYYVNSMGKNFGFLLKGKPFTDVLGLEGATTSIADGVNDSDEIVDVYKDANFKTHGFSLKGGKYTKLDVPGSKWHHDSDGGSTTRVTSSYIRTKPAWRRSLLDREFHRNPWRATPRWQLLYV